MTYTHSKLYGSASEGSLCQDSYCWGWLTPIEVGCPPYRPSLYLAVSSCFRVRRPSACPRLGVLSRPVTASRGQFQGEEKPWGLDQARSVDAQVFFTARVIAVSPCDSPGNRGGVSCNVASSSLLSSGGLFHFRYLRAIYYSVHLSVAISAVSVPVYIVADALP
jgi:hypothetical protein